MIKPTKRYSFWVLGLIGACAGLPAILPSIEGKIPNKTFVGLSILGMIAQFIKQHEENDDQSDKQ